LQTLEQSSTVGLSAPLNLQASPIQVSSSSLHHTSYVRGDNFRRLQNILQLILVRDIIHINEARIQRLVEHLELLYAARHDILRSFF
jgi:hypothetical protein